MMFLKDLKGKRENKNMKSAMTNVFLIWKLENGPINWDGTRGKVIFLYSKNENY